MTAQRSAGVHLIGSVPLDDADAVFRALASALGPHLRRVPDGETGERRRWIWWERQMLERHPDVAYFKPLADLRGYDDALLYLGLIHHDDRAGDRARINAARAVVAGFGVSSECGWGRTDPQRVPGLLESHRLAITGETP